MARTDGFLGALGLDREMLMDTGMSLVGGAGAGIGYTLLENNVTFFSEGTPNAALLKRLGAAAGLAIAGGMALSRAGASGEELAKGWVGGMGSVVGSLVVSRFAPNFLQPSVEVKAAQDSLDAQLRAERAGTPAVTSGLRGVGAMRSSRIQLAGTGLQSTRAYSGDDIPANVGRMNGLGRVNVSTPDPAELAALTAGAF